MQSIIAGIDACHKSAGRKVQALVTQGVCDSNPGIIKCGIIGGPLVAKFKGLRYEVLRWSVKYGNPVTHLFAVDDYCTLNSEYVKRISISTVSRCGHNRNAFYRLEGKQAIFRG